MKKILSVFVILACLCALLAMPVHGAQDPMAAKFQDALGRLDYFYDYDYNYMIRVATDAFVTWESRDPVSVSAAEFDAVLHKHFVITDNQIKELRELGNRDYSTTIYDEQTWQPIETIPFFNEETQTYTFQYYGGFGGMLAEREYWGYVINGATYDVYYRHITYQFLSEVLPEGTTESDLFGDSWPEKYEYQGVTYENGPDGYYTVKSRDSYGRKYTVEMNGDVVRIISCVNFTEADAPASFDDKNITYDIPQNSGVSIPENDCFTGNTTVKVEPVVSGSVFQTAQTAMAEVAEKFVAYEFTATKNNTAVQPNGKLTVTFAIPAGYSTDVAVYYMDANGTLEKLTASVNAAARTVTAELEHFSTYILAEVKQTTQPEPGPTEPTPTEPDPTEPDPTEPDPTEPDPTEPDPTEPDPTDPEPTEPTPTTPESDQEDEGFQLWWLIPVIAAVVIAGGAVVIALTRKKKQ